MKRITVAFLAILFASHAAPAGKFALTIDSIMRGPELYGYEPGQVRWSGDGRHIYFQWKQASDPRIKEPDTYVVENDGATLRMVYVRDGDIFPYDAASGSTRQITKTADAETDPHFTHDEKRVAFTRAN